MQQDALIVGSSFVIVNKSGIYRLKSNFVAHYETKQIMGGACLDRNTISGAWT